MLERIQGYIWNAGLLTLLLGTGLVMQVRIGWFPLRGAGRILRSTFGSLRRSTPATAHRTGVSQWSICTAALSAAMGTGNIIGVTAALAIGGAGAIFWMWISAILGMALTYAENVLAMRFRRSADSTMQGPMAYLRYGLGSRWLAGGYAVCCVAAAFGMGNMTQGSAAAESLYAAFSLPHGVTALLLTGLLAASVMGGIRSIGRLTQVLLPAVSAAYLLLALAVLVRNAAMLPAAFGQIFSEAFGIRPAGGAAFGTMLSAGLRHGVFSNEAGLGSSALIHSNAPDDPTGQQGSVQGMWSMVEVFLDTIVCCTLTALVILTTAVPGAIAPGSEAVSAAFGQILGQAAPAATSLMLAVFAICTMLGWCCCGETALRSLCRDRRWILLLYRAAFCIAGGVGALGALETVWTLSDIANGLMAFPNLLGLLLLQKFVKAPKKL